MCKIYLQPRPKFESFFFNLNANWGSWNIYGVAAFLVGITKLNQLIIYKDDIINATEFPFILRHPVSFTLFYMFWDTLYLLRIFICFETPCIFYVFYMFWDTLYLLRILYVLRHPVSFTYFYMFWDNLYLLRILYVLRHTVSFTYFICFETPCIFYVILYVLPIVKDEEHSYRINSSSWEAVDLNRFMTPTTTTTTTTIASTTTTTTSTSTTTIGQTGPWTITQCHPPPSGGHSYKKNTLKSHFCP